MSDFEDDMDVDVDAPPSKNSIQFSSDNTAAKGKRIAADLPVEAEDNLPWYVKQLDLESITGSYALQGGEIPTKYSERCCRTSRHFSDYQQVHRAQCECCESTRPLPI